MQIRPDCDMALANTICRDITHAVWVVTPIDIYLTDFGILLLNLLPYTLWTLNRPKPLISGHM